MKREKQKKGLEVADIFDQFGNEYQGHYSLSYRQLKVMSALQACRTAALGGHKDTCDRCGHERISYNSCRNRHCPKCQFLSKERWLLKRRNELLPITYFHIVFTLPHSLNPLALRNKKVTYDILFKAASETLLQLGRDPKHLGADIGLMAVLHTWGQNLMDHPHVHCIVTGGGLSTDGKRWIVPKKMTDGKFFFIHVNLISDLFKRKFIAYLNQAYEIDELNFVGKIKNLVSPNHFKQFKNELYKKKWITYCKETFGGPSAVMNYLGRYTHRVAITNHRIVQVKDEHVTFRWKDYRDRDHQKNMTIHVFEFIRRFLLHILPHGFFKIRYYGILANRNRPLKLKKCRELFKCLNHQDLSTIDWIQLFAELTGIDLRICPKCKEGRMRSTGLLTQMRHAPP
jgi:hypothetical protein